MGDARRLGWGWQTCVRRVSTGQRSDDNPRLDAPFLSSKLDCFEVCVNTF